MLALHMCQPSSRASAFVATIGVGGDRNTTIAQNVYRSIPSPGLHVAFSVGDPPLWCRPGTKDHWEIAPKARWITFPSHGVLTVPAQNFETVWATIRPQFALRVLGAFPEQLRSPSHDLTEFWGDRATQLVKQLDGCHSVPQKVEALEVALCEAFGAAPVEPDPRLDAAIEVLMTRGGQGTVDEACSIFGRAPKTFYNRVVAATGATPKTIARVARFYRASLVMSGVSIEQSSLINPEEYFDDAHFIRDFRAFVGMTPRAFVGQRLAKANTGSSGQFPAVLDRAEEAGLRRFLAEHAEAHERFGAVLGNLSGDSTEAWEFIYEERAKDNWLKYGPLLALWDGTASKTQSAETPLPWASGETERATRRQ